MLTPLTPKKVSLLGAAALAAVLGGLTGLGGRPAAAQDAKDGDAWKDYAYQESAECKRCHTTPTKDALKNQSLDFVLLTEYAVWRTHDKHAQAFAVLKGARGKQMGELLKVDVTKPEAGCVNCHAMWNLSQQNVAKGKGDRLALEDGVSCGGCHGPSTGWLTEHTRKDWRKKTPQEKFAKGMRDVRDPKVQAALCMSCHIGNAAEGKVVSHAMFAAGHPPLPPIEIATFAKNQPQHWRDVKDVPAFQDPDKYGIDLKNYHAENRAFHQTEFALIGNMVALRETMNLARERSGITGKVPLWGWPEFLTAKTPADDLTKPLNEALTDGQKRIDADWPLLALAHSDCYACHHDLRYPGFRQERGYGYHIPGLDLIGVPPGRVIVRAWPLGVLEAGADLAGQKGAIAGLQADLKKLAGAVSARPFGDPKDVGEAAGRLADWAEGVRKQLARTDLYKKESVRGLMHTLCRLYPGPDDWSAKGKAPAIPDYESARQVASILTTAYREWLAQAKDGEVPAEVKTILNELNKQLDLEPYIRRRARVDILIKAIARAASAENDRRFTADAKKFADYLGDIGNMNKLVAFTRAPSNQFLTTLLNSVGSAEYAEAVIGLASELQKLSDEEERQVLSSMADYRPAEFVRRLQRLDKALPK